LTALQCNRRSLWDGFHTLLTLRKSFVVMTYDVVLCLTATGLIIGSGTEPLHDLVTYIQATSAAK
jgi:NADH:ubiquinone oxidoreductase subunit H